MRTVGTMGTVFLLYYRVHRIQVFYRRFLNVTCFWCPHCPNCHILFKYNELSYIIAVPKAVLGVPI